MRSGFLPLVVRLNLGDAGIPDGLDIGGNLLVAGRQLLDRLARLFGFCIKRLPDRFTGLGSRALDGPQRIGSSRQRRLQSLGSLRREPHLGLDA